MKKAISLLLALLMLAAAPVTYAENELNIVCTIFPIYDWTRNITGSEANLTLLLNSGVDMHSYQPSVEDMIRLADCDLFICTGGESDAWVEDALSSAGSHARVLRLMDALGEDVLCTEDVEGMEHDHDHEEHHHEVDEHIWLSLKNAHVCVEAISAALSELEPADAETLAANAAAYLAQIDELELDYAAATAAAPGDTLLFGDRFPFRYLAEDYRLNYYAAFSGCSADSEASFETIAFLAQKLKELGLQTVLTTEGSDGELAETIVRNSGVEAQIIALDSMQSVNTADVQAGASYLGIMQANLAALEAALA